MTNLPFIALERLLEADRFPALRRLRLEDAPRTDDLWRLPRLGVGPGLEVLSFQGGISDVGVAALLRDLAALPRLREVELGTVWRVSEGLRGQLEAALEQRRSSGG